MNTFTLELATGRESTAEKQLTLQVKAMPEGKTKVLFDIIWNDAELKEWLSQNRQAILNEDIPTFGPRATCIAESVARFYDLEPDPPDAEFDAMHAYRTRHGFRFALRGVNIPDVYVGLFKGCHQVSVLEEGKPFFCYVCLNGLLD